MTRILHIDTATQACSAAISDDLELVAMRESHINKTHATLLTVFIEELLREARIKPAELDAIAVSKGPGSYTGLRIGVSTAKGLAYGSGLPLIAVNTLESMARGMANLLPEYGIPDGSNYFLCPMIDARRMEVYRMVLDAHFRIIRKTEAEIIHENSFNDMYSKGKVLFFGSGASKCQDLLNHKNAILISGFQNSAKDLIPLALEHYKKKMFEDVAYFEPYYLKDFVATIPKNKLHDSGGA